MGYISNRISKEKLQPGDHIYCYRALYSHHGIYLKEGKKDRVIHFKRKLKTCEKHKTCENCRGEQQAGEEEEKQGVVVKTCLDCFLDGDSLFLYKYKASKSMFMLKNPGTCTTGSADGPAIVLERAFEMLKTNGFGAYDLLTNNCETFAVYCKTGIRSSVQGILGLEFTKWKAILGLEIPKWEVLKKDIEVYKA